MIMMRNREAAHGSTVVVCLCSWQKSINVHFWQPCCLLLLASIWNGNYLQHSFKCTTVLGRHGANVTADGSAQVGSSCSVQQDRSWEQRYPSDTALILFTHLYHLGVPEFWIWWVHRPALWRSISQLWIWWLSWVQNGGCPVVLAMQTANLYSFTNLLLLACLLTPAIAMSFLLVLMSYHEKAQDDQTACTLNWTSMI